MAKHGDVFPLPQRWFPEPAACRGLSRDVVQHVSRRRARCNEAAECVNALNYSAGFPQTSGGHGFVSPQTPNALQKSITRTGLGCYQRTPLARQGVFAERIPNGVASSGL
eukprot:11390289-Heterocapsa_arctica.AAC.1